MIWELAAKVSIFFLTDGGKDLNALLMGSCKEEALPQKSVEILEAALKDPESLQCIGESAKSKALAWDEMAYGRRLLEILSTAVGG